MTQSRTRLEVIQGEREIVMGPKRMTEAPLSLSPEPGGDPGIGAWIMPMEQIENRLWLILAEEDPCEPNADEWA